MNNYRYIVKFSHLPLEQRSVFRARDRSLSSFCVCPIRTWENLTTIVIGSFVIVLGYLRELKKVKKDRKGRPKGKISFIKLSHLAQTNYSIKYKNSHLWPSTCRSVSENTSQLKFHPHLQWTELKWSRYIPTLLCSGLIRRVGFIGGKEGVGRLLHFLNINLYSFLFIR